MSEIAEDVAVSNVNFLAGGGYSYFVPMNGKIESNRKDKKNLLTEFDKQGYKTFIGEKSFNAFKNYVPSNDDKVFAAFSSDSMPYEIDRKSTNSKIPSLSEISKKAIDVLSKHNKPFFLMIEAEGTDTLSHRHDAHAMIHEALELDKAVKHAYNFYNKHPKDTLIIVTADHETGGLVLGDPKKYFLDISALMKTKGSTIHKFENFKSKDIMEIKVFVKENFGLDMLNKKEEKLLVAAINKELSKPNKKYSNAGKRPIAITIANIVSSRSGVSWGSTKHTAVPVVLTAIGAGSENFSGYLDNTQVSKKLASLLDFKLSEPLK